MKLRSARRPAVIVTAAAAALALGMTGSAVADALITSSDIKDNTIRGKDIKDSAIRAADIRTGAVSTDEVLNGSLALNDLSGGAISGIQNGVFVGENWGVNLRNTQGTASATLRSGPVTTNFGGSTKPPVGTGSLMLQSTGGAAKVDFGNEVDYSNKNLASAIGGKVGFSVFTTDENEGHGDKNLPVVRFEVDPNLSNHATNYSTLVFVPNKEPDAGKWTSYTQTDGVWFLTGAAGTAAGCSLSSPCSFANVMAPLANATIQSVSIGTNGTSGPDFVGAVDAFRIGNTVYDFEARGVFARNA